MSDDISIPNTGAARMAYSHSYRARRNGLDAGTKRLMLAASALGVLLLGGMGVWALSGHRSAAGVPRIEADSRPLRIKPENPGGMEAIGLIDAAGPDAAAGSLAPVAEKPDPQALVAQRTAPPGAPMLAPAVITPTTAPAVVTPAVVPAATGKVMVQLGSVDSEKGAAAEWQRLSRKMPEVLGERQMVAQRAELNGKAVWRVRTGGFSDVADATQFCKRVRAKNLGCSLANY